MKPKCIFVMGENARCDKPAKKGTMFCSSHQPLAGVVLRKPSELDNYDDIIGNVKRAVQSLEDAAETEDDELLQKRLNLVRGLCSLYAVALKAMELRDKRLLLKEVEAQLAPLDDISDDDLASFVLAARASGAAQGH